MMNLKDAIQQNQYDKKIHTAVNNNRSINFVSDVALTFDFTDVYYIFSLLQPAVRHSIILCICSSDGVFCYWL